MIILYTAPADAPSVIAHAVNSTTLWVMWKPPLIPNGVLIRYWLYVNFKNGSELSVTEVGAQSSSYYVVNLYPQQHIIVSMSADTAVGRGPHSLGITVTTLEQEPNTAETLKNRSTAVTPDQDSSTVLTPENVLQNHQKDNTLPIAAGMSVPTALLIVLCAVITLYVWRKVKRCDTA